MLQWFAFALGGLTTVIAWVLEKPFWMEAGMRRIVLAGSVLALVIGLAPQLTAQQEKSARGTVTAITGNMISVKAGTSEMKFAFDAKTIVTVEGGGTANRAAAEKGTGPKLSELVKVGDAVEVGYHETGATLHAARIRRVPSAGSGGGTTSDQRAAAKSETSNGTVESVTGSALTITGTSGGGASFKQTFTIDSNTRLVGEGVGTAAAKTGVRALEANTKVFLHGNNDIHVLQGIPTWDLRRDRLLPNIPVIQL